MKKILLTTLSIIALLISGNLMATNYVTSNGVTWVDENGASISAPSTPIASSDSVVLLSPSSGSYNVSFAGGLTNTGVLVINVNTSVSAAAVTNTGTILLYGALDVTFTVINTGVINGTGTISSFLSSLLPPGSLSPITPNTGTVNGCSGSGCVGPNSPTNIGLPPPSGSGSNITYTTGTLAPTTCDDNVAFQGDYTLNVATGTVRDIGNISVAIGVTLTINSPVALSLCGDINNDGTIIVNVGGALAQLGASDDNQGGGTYEIKQTGHSSILQYNIWSSPVDGAVLINDNASSGYEVFTGTNACDIYTYQSSTQEWKYDFLGAPAAYDCANSNTVIFNSNDLISGGDGVMDFGQGYFVPGNGSATRSFNGEIHNGSISFGVSSSWNLLGNPYPSALSASQFLTDNTNVNTVYFWADDNTAGSGYDQSTGYASHNGTGGVAASSAGSSITTPNGSIAVAQGFWVEVSSGTTVDFNNAQRSTTPDVFFKKENENKQLIWLNVKTPVMNNTVLVGLLPVATDNYDERYDAKFLDGGAASRLVTVIGTDEFSIQAIAPLTYGETKTVSLKMVTGIAGDHIFAEYKRENISAGMAVYLKDNVTNTLHDLTTSDYVVHLDGNQTYDTRFELVFVSNVNQDIDDQTTKGDVATDVDEVNTSTFTLLSEANGYTLFNKEGINGDITVLDLTGKVVWTKLNIQSSTSIQINMNGVSSGMYVIQVLNNNERVYTNKIVKR